MNIKLTAGLILALSAAARPSTAQMRAEAGGEGSPLGVSGSFGLGPATHGFGGLLSLGLSTAAGEFVLRAAAAEEFAIFSTPESSEDFALLYGRRVTGDKTFLRIAAGPGLARTVRPGSAESCYLIFCEYDKIETSRLGLALQLEAIWALSQWFGLGLDAFGNVNSDASFVGLTLGVHLGRLR